MTRHDDDQGSHPYHHEARIPFFLINGVDDCHNRHSHCQEKSVSFSKKASTTSQSRYHSKNLFFSPSLNGTIDDNHHLYYARKYWLLFLQY